MTLSSLIDGIKTQGYTLNGSLDERCLSLLPNEVWTVAAVLIPKEPPVQEECVFVANYLTWEGGVGGYARVECAATVGPYVVPLQFVRNT